MQHALVAVGELVKRRLRLVQIVIGVEKKVEVLEGFSEEKALHPVIELVGLDVFDLQQQQQGNRVNFNCKFKLEDISWSQDGSG